jgi:hypothetical protein
VFGRRVRLMKDMLTGFYAEMIFVVNVLFEFPRKSGDTGAFSAITFAT